MPQGNEPEGAPSPAPPADPACATSPRAERLEREAIVRAAAGAESPLRARPVLLPAAWPDHRGQVEVVFFTHAALPTGVVAYAVRGPERRVAVSVGDGSVEVRPVGESTVEGVEQPSPASDEARAALGDAEEALLDLAAGRTCLDPARPRLRAYCAWLASDGVEAEWAREVAAPFFEALGCDAR